MMAAAAASVVIAAVDVVVDTASCAVAEVSAVRVPLAAVVVAAANVASDRCGLARAGPSTSRSVRPRQRSTVINAAVATATPVAPVTQAAVAAAANRYTRLRGLARDLHPDVWCCGCPGSAAACASARASHSVACSVYKKPPAASWTDAVTVPPPKLLLWPPFG